MKASKKTLSYVLTTALLALALAACRERTAGDRLDDALDDVGDAVEDAGDAIKSK